MNGPRVRAHCLFCPSVHISVYVSHHPDIVLLFMSIQDGCTLSNHPIVGVHNIATTDDPYIIAVTGDLARVSFSGKAVTMCGAKQCDRRLVSQQLTGNQGHMNQSRTLYTPAIGGYSSESDMMPLFEQLVDAHGDICSN